MELIKSILIESLSTKGLTVFQHGILKRLDNGTLDLDNASENTLDNIFYMEDRGIISNFKLTKDGIELLNLLNSVGTKDKSEVKSRNRLRPKMKIGDTDINLRTGNKFKTDNRHSQYDRHPELRGNGGGPRAKSNRMSHIRDLFGFDEDDI